MTREAIMERLNSIFRDVFDEPTLQIRDDMTAADVEGWDSLSYIDLIVSVEKELSVKFTTVEIRTLNNVGDFVSLIEKKTAA